MTYDFFMGQLRLIAIGIISYLAGSGRLSNSDAGALTNILAPVGLLAAPWLWSLYTNFNVKFVPHNSVAVAPESVTAGAIIGGTVMAKQTQMKVVGALAAFMILAAPAYAADNLAIKSPTVAAPANCQSADNCSGWYAGFGLLGDGSIANVIGVGLQNSVFQNGAGVLAVGGYQLWKGSLLAGVQISAGYEFTSTSLPVTNSQGSKFVGTELIQLGYNFFPNAGSAATTPSQSPSSMLVPSNFLAATTPYLNIGGMQWHGISGAATGMGLQTVMSAGWSSALDYLYAPSQQGQPANQVVTLKILKHF